MKHTALAAASARAELDVHAEGLASLEEAADWTCFCLAVFF